MRAVTDAAEGHPGMPSDEEVNAAAKVFCGGVWNGFDPASMMPTEQFDRFWGDGEGHQLYLEIARHALTAAIAASGVAAEAEALPTGRPTWRPRNGVKPDSPSSPLSP